MFNLLLSHLKTISGINLVPDGWDYDRIKNKCDLGRGRVISQIEIHENPGLYPVFSSQTTDEGCMGHLATYDFEGEYATWTTDGANAGTVFYRNGKFNCTNVCGTIQPKNDQSIDLKFLAYHLNRISKRYVSYHGNPKLMNDVMGNIAITFPPFKEQSAIAAILDTLDEAIRRTEAVIAKMRQVKAGMLQDILTRGLDKNGELRDPIRHPEQFKDSPLGMIPKDWDSIFLTKLCMHIGSGVTPRGGQEVYTSKGILFIRSQNVTFDGLKLEDIAHIPVRIHNGMLRSEVFAHDVLFNITGASIGRCCPMPDGMGEANVNQHVCILRVPDATESDAIFLATTLGSHLGQKQLEALNTCGNRQGLNYQQLGLFIVPWPEAFERELIAKKIQKINAQLEFEINGLRKMKCLKQGLMQDLLTGHVRVPEAMIEKYRSDTEVNENER